MMASGQAAGYGVGRRCRLAERGSQRRARRGRWNQLGEWASRRGTKCAVDDDATLASGPAGGERAAERAGKPSRQGGPSGQADRPVASGVPRGREASLASGRVAEGRRVVGVLGWWCRGDLPGDGGAGWRAGLVGSTTATELSGGAGELHGLRWMGGLVLAS
jgi:hypothetical protein